MFRKFREAVKRIPFLGRGLYAAYLKIFFDEGKVLEIKGGPLQGKKWVQFMQTYYEGYIIGDYEPDVQKALARLIRTGTVFYDIGANAGYFSLLGAQLVGTAGRVVAFEPHPIVAKKLKRQIRVNGIENVDVRVCAVSDQVGTSIFTDSDTTVMNTLVNADKAMRTIVVKTTTLDVEMRILPPPDVMKIDVEGAEISVLRGARELLQRSRPTILAEIHSAHLGVQYEALMSEFGYGTTDISGKAVSAEGSGTKTLLSTPLERI